MMRYIMFFLKNLFDFKKVLRHYFKFLEDEYQFYETTNDNLIIPEWLIRGVVYTNEKIVIIVVDDILEKRFETIIYEIQENLKIPIYDSELYFSLEEFLKKKGINAHFISNYENLKELKRSIEETIFYLNKYSDELLYR